MDDVEHGRVVDSGTLHVERDEQADRGGQHVADTGDHLGSIANFVDKRLDDDVNSEQRRHDDDERGLLHHQHGTGRKRAKDAVVFG